MANESVCKVSKDNLHTMVGGASMGSSTATVASSSLPGNPFIKELSQFHKADPFKIFPAEINDQIFEEALATDKIQVCGVFKEPGIMRANKVYRNTYLVKYYAVNTFGIDVPHFGGMPTFDWVNRIKHVAVDMGLEKTCHIGKFVIHLGFLDGMEAQKTGLGKDINYKEVGTLNLVFHKAVRLELAVELDDPASEGAFLDFSFPLGSPKTAMTRFQKMREAYTDEDASLHDLGRMIQFDDDAIMLRDLIQVMPQF